MSRPNTAVLLFLVDKTTEDFARVCVELLLQAQLQNLEQTSPWNQENRSRGWQAGVSRQKKVLVCFPVGVRTSNNTLRSKGVVILLVAICEGITIDLFSLTINRRREERGEREGEREGDMW